LTVGDVWIASATPRKDGGKV